jgi:PrkA serine protein kinase C-terminal domain
VAAYYSVLTRLFPPSRMKFPLNWSREKQDLYNSITPEQKLFIYAAQSEDPIQTIKNLPPWDPFRNECQRLGINLEDEAFLETFVVKHPDALLLKESGLFTDHELKLIDDEFMRELRNEQYPEEGRYGLSIRQLQNIMRNTISISDGRKVTVSIFLDQLEHVLREGEDVHHWLELGTPDFSQKPWEKLPIQAREIGNIFLDDGEGDYGDFEGLIHVVRGIYHSTLKSEITVATVDRDPVRIEYDLRKYLQHALLEKAIENKAFAHVLVPRYTYIDSNSGEKVDRPDIQFLKSIEAIIHPDDYNGIYRRKLAQKYLDLHSSGEITTDPEKSLISSRNDNLLSAFSDEFTALLSHRKSIDGIDPETLRDAFFQRQNSAKKYQKMPAPIRAQVDTILKNMVTRFNYPESIALDTVIYAIRNHIVNFNEILA